VNDDEIADAWEAGRVFEGGVSHEQHVRIAWVLHRRHGREEAMVRLLKGTERACRVHGCPEKFDPALTARWANEIAERADRDGMAGSADEFIARHPELLRVDLVASPSRQRRR
jgi:hypothetical protein